MGHTQSEPPTYSVGPTSRESFGAPVGWADVRFVAACQSPDPKRSLRTPLRENEFARRRLVTNAEEVLTIRIAQKCLCIFSRRELDDDHPLRLQSPSIVVG